MTKTKEDREFAKRGDSYIITDGSVEGGFFATITPTQGVFEVEVIEEEHELVSDEEMFDIYGVGTYYERYENPRLKTSELTVEDVQKAFDQYDIKMPEKLAEELSEWRRAFFESEAYAEAMHMAATESGDSDGRLTPEEVEMIYGPEERLRLFGSALAEGD